MELTASIVRRDAFDAALTTQLYGLYSVYYAPTSSEVFVQDLASKSYCIVLRDSTGTICGFSTVAQFRLSTAVGDVEVLYSGDTVVERSHWGELTLPYTWIQEAGRIKAAARTVPLYWLLITKGHRTFRYLPGFAWTYCPGPDLALQALRDEVAEQVFGSRYDARTGILAPDPACPTALQPVYAGLDRARTGNHRIADFLSQNPGHAQGEELVCLCELSVENLKPRALRQFMKGLG